MIFLEYVLWISCFLIFYNYAGYAVIVYVCNLLHKKKQVLFTDEQLPGVSFIVAAFNEEDCIEKKILKS